MKNSLRFIPPLNEAANSLGPAVNVSFSVATRSFTEVPCQLLAFSQVLRGPRRLDIAPNDASYRATTFSPRVVHCIAGSARTLGYSHTYRNLQGTFIDALGGTYSTLMHVKLV